MPDTPPLLFTRRFSGLFPANAAAEEAGFVCDHCGAYRTKADYPHKAHHEFARQRYCDRACSGAARMARPDERFDASYQVSENGCWIWQKSRNWAGYGTFCIYRSRVIAHRYSYERFHGPLLDGQVVMHKCDNPGCVNPDHLEAGTQLENIRDAKRKNRIAHGSRQGSAKLTEEQAAEIRTSTASGVALSRRFGIAESTISQIRSGERWRRA